MKRFYSENLLDEQSAATPELSIQMWICTFFIKCLSSLRCILSEIVLELLYLGCGFFDIYLLKDLDDALFEEGECGFANISPSLWNRVCLS